MLPSLPVPKKKKWYRSKTLWVNLLTFVGSLATVVSPLQGLIEPTHYLIALSVIAAANVGLRMVTTEGIDK
jgi:hypothetical protein